MGNVLNIVLKVGAGCGVVYGVEKVVSGIVYAVNHFKEKKN